MVRSGVSMFVMAILGLLAGDLPAQGLRLESPYLQKYHSPLQDPPYRNPLGVVDDAGAALLKVNTKLFTTSEDIDFEKRQVTFTTKDKLGFDFWAYHFGELSDYLFSGMRYSLFDGWYRDVATKDRSKAEKQQRTSLDFALPIQYPKWAQRILGKEPPKLSIDGHLTLTVSYDNTRQEPSIEFGRESSGFQFNQENSFTIRGSIGRVINISISAGSEEEFNLENQLKNFKIEYKDDANELEDEVIQEIVAGYTGFQMPGQGLAGYSESHEGLFGIKIRSKIGPLQLTTIASHEQGESQKLSVSRGAAAAGMTNHRESSFRAYRYFFLDTLYYRHYIKKRLGRSDTVAVPAVEFVDLWIQTAAAEQGQGESNERFRRANVSGDRELLFRRLRSGEYYFEPNEGWVRLDSVTVNEDVVLGMVLRTSDPALVPDKGDSTVVGATGGVDVMHSLEILKDEQPAPTQPSFPLAWRNVYAMDRNVDPSQFTIRVFYSSATEDTVEYFNGKRISYILGLTDEAGVANLGRTDIYHRESGSLIIPPFADSIADSIADIKNLHPFRNPALGDSVVPEIYTETKTVYTRSHIPKFTISMSGVTTGESDVISNLGWGVMKGTEKVTMDGGTKLSRDRDYIIDYEMGSIELISPRAKAANRIEVEYQREALFVPEEKVFLGAHGQVDLPLLGKNSFVGATVMYQSASTSEKIPRIGQEPYNKFLLDFNTSLDYEPLWMTRLFAWLPSARTDAESKLKLDFEVAHSRMNPNTQDTAYVDDFEAAKQSFPISLSERNWKQSSPPVYLVQGDSTVVPVPGDTLDDVDLLLYHPPAWETYWFQPDANDSSMLVRKDQIYTDPAIGNLKSSDKYEPVLRLHTIPKPQATVDPSIRAGYTDPWAGIMTHLPGSFRDRSQDKYLEFWAFAGARGRINIDLGVISEDVCINGGPPNGVLNTEDSTGLYEPNAALDLGLDTLDVVRFSDGTYGGEYYVYPNQTSGAWDTIYAHDPRVGEDNVRFSDPARDNWRDYGEDHVENRRYTNGLQGNGGTLNSEDINLDADYVRTTRESFFRATIDFDSLQYVYDSLRLAGVVTYYRDLPQEFATRFFVDKEATPAAGGWLHFRIPLQDTARLSRIRANGAPEPSLSNIAGVRIFWDGHESVGAGEERQFLFTGMQFVGNQWQEVPMFLNGDSTLPVYKIEASAINNVDSRPGGTDSLNYYDEAYPLLHRRTWEKDANGNYKREQALQLYHGGLEHGEVALVERTFTYRTFDLSNYKRLGLLVYSDQDLSLHRTRFVFRFGSDSSTYYEYRSGYLQPGWDPNTVDIELREYSQMKLDYLTVHGEDSLGAFDTMSVDGHFVIHSSSGRLPSFSGIAWMALGVMRDSAVGGMNGPTPDCVLWVNEMQVTGVRELNGWAMRTSLNTQWGDFMDVALNAEYTDADFRTMTDNLAKQSNTVLKGGLNANWHLDKFLPERWGVSLPFGTSISGSLTRPLKKPNTDIYLTNEEGEADRLSDMLVDALGAITGSGGDGVTTEAEHYQTLQVSRTMYARYEKAAKSDKTVTRLTAERIKAEYNYRYDLRGDAKGERPRGGDYVDTTETVTHSAKLSYDLSPKSPPKWTKWKPFDGIKTTWFPSPLKNYELSLLPSTLTFNVLDIRYANDLKVLSRSEVRDRVRSLDVSHGFNTSYSPVSPLLSLGLNLSVNRALDEDVTDAAGMGEASDWLDLWKDALWQRHEDPAWRDYYLLRGEESRKQGASVTFKPQFFDWLTHDFTYNADFGEQPGAYLQDSATAYYNFSVGTRLGFQSRFDLTGFLRGLSDKTKKVEWLSKGFSGAQKGLDKIGLRSVNFSYNARMDLKNNTVGTDYLDAAGDPDAWDFFKYKLGAGRSLSDVLTGSMDDADDYGGVQHRARMGDEFGRYKDDLRTTTQDFSLSTSFRIPDPISFNFNPVRLSWDRRYSVKEDTLWWDTTRTWPKLVVGASSNVLSKISFVKKHMRRVSLSSQYTYSKEKSQKGLATEDANGNVMGPTRNTSTKHSWSPLVKVDGTVKKQPIKVNYEHRYDSDTQRGETLNRTEKHSDKITVSYELRRTGKERSLKIFKWKIPIKGKLTVSADAEMVNTTGWKNLADSTMLSELEGQIDPTTDLNEMSLRPRLTYQFTNNIDGTLQYTGSREEDAVADQKTYSHLIELIVKIRF